MVCTSLAFGVANVCVAQDITTGLLLYIRAANDKQNVKLRTSNDYSQRNNNANNANTRSNVNNNNNNNNNNKASIVRSNSNPENNAIYKQIFANDKFFGTMKGIEARRAEIRGILIARNRMANHIREYSFNPEHSELPPVIKSPFTCEHCFVSDSCMVYHKVCHISTFPLLILLFVGLRKRRRYLQWSGRSILQANCSSYTKSRTVSQSYIAITKILVHKIF